MHSTLITREATRCSFALHTVVKRDRTRFVPVQAADAMCRDLDTYILDAGLDSGAELPYTCRGGICGACVGRVVEGEVDMSDVDDISFTLSEEEQAQGLALLCMARPLSDAVVIETQSDWGYSLGTAEGWKGATGEIAGKAPEPLNPWGSDA